MSDTKISALAALTGANTDNTADVLAIVDTSAGATKKILVNELAIAVSSSPVTFINKSMNVSTNTFNFTPITASLGGDVALNNTANYFDGPSIAQGTSGTWWVSGKVTVQSGAANNDSISAKLWDGTTVIDSAQLSIILSGSGVIALSGYIVSPVGNLKISVKDASETTGKIIFNGSGNSADSTISAVRIA